MAIEYYNHSRKFSDWKIRPALQGEEPFPGIPARLTFPLRSFLLPLVMLGQALGCATRFPAVVALVSV